MAFNRVLALGLLLAIGGTAAANDKNKIYPKFESKYIKRITQPQINCGACFGYYPTNWRSFNEACGIPETVYVRQTEPEVKPVEPKNTPEVSPQPKAPDVAPTPNPSAPKVPDPVPLPVPDPKPVEPKKPGDSGRSSHSPAPLPATAVSITIPAVPEIAPIPLIPVSPSVNVK